MENLSIEPLKNVPNAAAGFGMVPNPSEDFGNVPQPSESFGGVPHASESFRTLRQLSERTEKHTQTVRDVARQFDEAGVSRTERSIINWCRPNRQGVARLDAFFDENERRYYITSESVTRAIAEEKAKQPIAAPKAPEPDDEIPKRAESSRRDDSKIDERIKELERQNRDLEITTRAKDFYIERLDKERRGFVEQLISMSRHVGELETEMLQLGGAPRRDRILSKPSETFGRKARGSEEDSAYHPARERNL